MQTLPLKIMEQSRLRPQNHGDIVSGPKNILKLNFLLFFSDYFSKSVIFQTSLHPFGPLYKEKIFYVAVPLKKWMVLCHFVLALTVKAGRKITLIH
jgi:hypothetical protein